MAFLVSRPREAGVDGLDEAIERLYAGRYPAVHMQWLDPAGNSEWVDLPCHDEERLVKYCQSMGWLVHADENSVTLATHLSHRGELTSEPDAMFGDVHVPRVCVVAMALLG